VRGIEARGWGGPAGRGLRRKKERKKEKGRERDQPCRFPALLAYASVPLLWSLRHHRYRYCCYLPPVVGLPRKRWADGRLVKGPGWLPEP
jgi:hypothetical protein